MNAPHANVPADWADDPYWAAAVCLLHPLGARAFDFASGDGIDYPGMLAAGWSAGERRLIEAAASLWDSNHTVSLLDLATGLDHGNWTRLLQALHIIRQGLR